MEFSTSRGTQAPAPARVASNGGTGAPSGAGNGKMKNMGWRTSPFWLRVVWLVLLFAGTILVLGMLVLLYFGGPKEFNYVNKNQEQAVFLTNGQVYFGQIKAVNKQYVDLQGIYYLNVNQQVQPDQKSSSSSSNSNQTVSLVKLGCELHGPVDQMIINRDQITFWENLKSDGQVSKAIAQWVQQNPKGQTCTTASSNSSSNSSSSSNSTNP